MEIQHYSSFLAAVALFQIVPGAGTLAILAATARAGKAGGFAAVAGTLLGDALYMLAALLGLGVVMQGLPALFSALQWAGAGYLLWLGWQWLRTPTPADAGSQAPPTPAACFRRALAVALTNPKVVLFFVSFFPLFLSPQASLPSLLLLAAHVTLISLFWQSLLVLLGHQAARRLARWPHARRWAMRLGGISLIALGLKLANDSR